MLPTRISITQVQIVEKCNILQRIITRFAYCVAVSDEITTKAIFYAWNEITGQ